MNENLKTTIVQKLGEMTDETGRQLLDYMEYLESKYNRSSRERSTLERLAENVEGTLRSSRLGEAAVKGTGGIIDAAGSVARSVAAAGQAVIDELQHVVNEDTKKNVEKTQNDGTEEARGEKSAEGSEKETTKPKATEADEETDEAGGKEKSA